MSMIHLTSLRLNNSIQFLDTSSITIGLEFVFLNPCSAISDNLLFLSFKENPDLLIFWVATWVFSDAWTWRTKFMCGSPRSYMTDRQRLTWQPTFFESVVSLSTARWFFTLLSEQWWRERSADGFVTDLRVMQVRGPRVAGLLLEENFSGLWVVELVEEAGLITCERGFIGQRARLLIGRSAQGILLRTYPHGRGKGRSQSSGGWSGRWERQMKSAKRGSKREQTITQAHDTWMGWRAQTLEPMSCDITLQVRTNTRKTRRVRCTVYTPRRLQQIAISCKRTYYNNFFIRKISTNFYPTAAMKNWKKTDATFGIDEKGWVLHVILLILGGDGSLMWLRFGCLIGVSSVHFARFVECEIPMFLISLEFISG